MRCARMTRGGRHGLIPAAALLGLIIDEGSARATELLSQKVLPLSLATEAAQAAVAACEGKGFHISVAVTDQAGLVRVLLRDDKAGPHTPDSSMKKAYTATSLGMSTGGWCAKTPSVRRLPC
jgi:uncharacterized protein GlcG (DUF336 family)